MSNFQKRAILIYYSGPELNHQCLEAIVNEIVSNPFVSKSGIAMVTFEESELSKLPKKEFSKHVTVFKRLILTAFVKNNTLLLNQHEDIMKFFKHLLLDEIPQEDIEAMYQMVPERRLANILNIEEFKKQLALFLVKSF